MRIFTKQDWKGSFVQSINDPIFFDWQTQTAEVSEEIYENFLESLPPIGIYKGFMNSEPYSHNSNGEALYNAFQHVDGKFYYIGLLTRKKGKLLQDKANNTVQFFKKGDV